MQKKSLPARTLRGIPVCTAYCRRLTKCEIDFSMLAAHIYNVVPVVAGSRVRIRFVDDYDAGAYRFVVTLKRQLVVMLKSRAWFCHADETRLLFVESKLQEPLQPELMTTQVGATWPHR